ncbi:DNA-processing protein DprA [Labedaea rhizosphaerae]|uniref:DNA processing protein n=1 Tax=Labedaea rhizosphaerae TaxID=598644 RepID=A0A4R6SI36_LABRH|nr:DNA-processing protein DprA [Labedaea rhizosphaerae]TDQ00618.1 DNA processing protein [Labedaea rhizosphaerae]
MNVHGHPANTGARRDDDDEIRQARAYLMSITEPPGHALRAFVQMVGPIEAAMRVRDGTAPSCVIDEATPRTAHHRMVPVSEQFACASAADARLLIPEDPDWPAEALRPLTTTHEDPHRHGVPLGLWVRGTADLGHALTCAISIVGARAATEYGAQVATEFGHDLAKLGAVIVAGTGHGIDAAAHRGAHAALGSTIAVLANGIAVTHPHSNGPLIDQIADSGLVISEYPPTAQPTRRRHHLARRLIAGATGGLVVVESLRRRGPVDAAATACALGRPVMVVPGPITSVMSSGCLELLRHGQAVAVGSAEHVWQTCGFPVAPGSRSE